jgi:cytochrome P450
MSQYVMHHDPRYFSDPDLFYPDRWTKEAKLQIPRFSYFPFGGGIRGCVSETLCMDGGNIINSYNLPGVEDAS